MKAFFVAFLAVAAADPAVLLRGVNPSFYTAGVVPQANIYGIPQTNVYGIPQTNVYGVQQPVVGVQPSTYIKPEVQSQKVTTYVEKKENKVQPDIYNKVEKKVEYEHRQPIHHVVSSYTGLPVTSYAGVPQVVNPVLTKKYEAKSGPVEHTVINKQHLLYKREAEAEADPLMYINQGVYGYNPLVNTYSGLYNPLQYRLPVAVPTTRQYFAKSGPVEHSVINKREAEADADSFYNPYALSGIYNPLTYGRPVYPTYGSYLPTRYSLPVAGFGAKTFANDAIRPENYGSKGNYVAQTQGSIHLAKREAEAESDPALLIPSVYNTAALRYPYTSTAYTYPYNTYSGVYRYPAVRSIYGF